jgi:hypothetical protein
MLRDQATQLAPVPTAAQLRLINRPTIDLAAYRDAKALAARDRSATKPIEPEAPPALKAKNFNGLNQNQSGGGFPPDTHGAAGPDHFFEIVNQEVAIFRQSDKVKVLDVSLASFFDFSLTPLFDPRVFYDQGRDRWIVSTVGFPINATTQPFFVAVSESSDPLGGYNIYGFDVDLEDDGSFFDFPSVGEDRNTGALLITANRFGAVFLGADLIVFPKACPYSGAASCNFGIFLHLPVANLAPPIVLDNSSAAWLISAPPNVSPGNKLKRFKLTKSNDLLNVMLTGPANITVGSFSVPPNAEQPPPCAAAANELDTSDARFANSSTQIGNTLYQVHSINDAGFPVNRYYRIDAATKTVLATDDFFSTATSFDFNPSIAANLAGDIVVTWSVTDPTKGTNPQVRFSGRLATDPPAIPAGSALFTSGACLTDNFDPDRGFQRWGDYSAVSLDPDVASQFWLVNETVRNSSAWGSRIGRVGF